MFKLKRWLCQWGAHGWRGTQGWFFSEMGGDIVAGLDNVITMQSMAEAHNKLLDMSGEFARGAIRLKENTIKRLLMHLWGCSESELLAEVTARKTVLELRTHINNREVEHLYVDNVHYGEFSIVFDAEVCMMWYVFAPTDKFPQ